jgi:hypothetical protein
VYGDEVLFTALRLGYLEQRTDRRRKKDVEKVRVRSFIMTALHEILLD